MSKSDEILTNSIAVLNLLEMSAMTGALVEQDSQDGVAVVIRNVINDLEKLRDGTEDDDIVLETGGIDLEPDTEAPEILGGLQL